jgi:peptide deformylase
MSLEIVHYNTPVLREKGEKVTTFDADLSAFAAAMVQAMHEARGIGLAAQQVGRALQICVIDLRESEADFAWKLDGASPPLELFMPMVLVNPKVILPKKPETASSEEGCLSFPEIRGEIERPLALTVKFQDAAGLPHVLECDGLFARCVQHEVDHLNGILFIERMTKAVRATIDEEVKALARRTKSGKSAAPS